MRIFAGVPQEGRQSNDSNGHVLRLIILLIFTVNMCHLATNLRLLPLSSTGTLIREFERKKNESVIFLCQMSSKCRIFKSLTIRPTMKSIIHHAIHYTLT